LVGLIWGWMAYEIRSLRWSLASHVVTDACGLGNARRFVGRTT
jgi:hypothetical protein